MILFRYESALLERFPTIRGGVILARELAGGPTPGELEDAFRREQAAALSRLGGASLAEVPGLAAWRKTFSAFGVKPTQYRSAAEALLRRLTKKGEIPCVNLLVDVGNLVSIRYALPVAVLDARGLTGTLTVRFAEGTETFTELDSPEVTAPEPGEVIFADAAGVVSARRWCWRQSAKSAARDSTREALITVEAHHPGAESEVAAAVRDLVELLTRFAGADCRSAVLSPAQPEFEVPG